MDDSTIRTYQDYMVGWICALPTEMAAARAMLDEFHDPLQQDSKDDNNYTLGRIGGHNVVLACLLAGVTGTISATRVVTHTLSNFKWLRFGLMVGIGGGVPSKENDIRLGDVVHSLLFYLSSPARRRSGFPSWSWTGWVAPIEFLLLYDGRPSWFYSDKLRFWFEPNIRSLGQDGIASASRYLHVEGLVLNIDDMSSFERELSVKVTDELTPDISYLPEHMLLSPNTLAISLMSKRVERSWNGYYQVIPGVDEQPPWKGIYLGGHTYGDLGQFCKRQNFSRASLHFFVLVAPKNGLYERVGIAKFTSISDTCELPMQEDGLRLG